MKARLSRSRFVVCGALGAFFAGAFVVQGAVETGMPASRPVPPPPVYSAPTFADVKIPHPILDAVFKADPISLETNGKRPREAFDMLGQAAGVTFAAGRDPAPPGGTQRSIWEMKSYAPLDFDIKKLNFWQAATKIGDAAGLFPLGGHRVMSLEAMPPSWVFTTSYPKQIMDMRALRATLSTMMTSGSRLDIGFSINLQVDPRVKMLAVGKVVWLGTGAGEGMPENIQAHEQKYPGSDTLRRTYTGIQSISQSLVFRGLQDKDADVTFEWLRGFVPVTAALATRPVVFEFTGDEMKDQEPHEIGDWRVTASAVRVLPRPNGPMGGRMPPDHALTITMERLKDSAPPFPQNPQAIFSAEGNGSISVTSKEEKKQEWTFSYYSSVNPGREPVKKILIDVPMDSQDVVLPFEFKHVVFSALP
jgi:hypothetical protein